jgi:ethanolamine utilization protein EutP (predicted NTPase)
MIEHKFWYKVFVTSVYDGDTITLVKNGLAEKKEY